MIKRTFICGSEWFYIKLYSGPKTLEALFINEVYKKILDLLEKDLIDSFFFVRYIDPDYHIRLRLHIKHINHISLIINSLYELLETYTLNYVLKKITIDTYCREIERYGIRNIIDIERIFYLDSSFIINYLISHDGKDWNRWLVTIKYIDLLLNNCGFSLNNKLEFCSKMSSSYSNEIYSNNKFVKIQLDKKYRNYKNEITQIIESKKIQNNWIDDLKSYLNQITSFTSKIKYQDKNTFPLLNSIIHMHVNRMFRTKQRVNECVIYYLLFKYYKSKSSRINK